MKRLITFLHSKCRRSVMTLLLLFAAMSGVWAADSDYLRWGIDGQSQSGSISITYDGSGYGTATLSNLKANTTYWFDFTNDSGTKYGNTGTMTSTNCTGWKFESGKESCKIETTVAGDYVLKVSWKEEYGTWYPWVDVTYPTASTGGKIHYGTLNGSYWENKTDANLNADGSVSINLTAGNTYAFVYQEGGKTYKFSNNPKIFTKTETDVETKVEGVDNFSGNGQIKASVTGTYTFKVTKTDGRLYMSVTFPDPIDYYITSNGLTEKGNVYDGKYYFSLPASYYDKETGKITFNISKGLNGATTYLTATNTAFSGHNNSEISSVTDGATSPVEFTYTTPSGTKNDEPSGDISVVYDPSNGKLTLSYESAQDIIGYSYYLIVPDANVGTTSSTVEGIAPANHKAFRLQAGRKRNSEELINDLTTLTLKIDGKQLRFDDENKIRFYIQNGEGNLFLQPDNNDVNRNIKPDITSTNGVDGYDTRTKNMSGSKADDEYYIINMTDVGDTKSLTFMFSKDNAKRSETDYKPGNSINAFDKNGNLVVGFLKSRGVNSNYYNNHISSKRVYLVGSLNGTKYLSGSNVTDKTQDDYYDKTKYEMKPNYWYGGVIDNKRTDIENADSIVYSCEIRRGSASWDNFFLSFSTEDKLGHNADGDQNNMWNPMLRPHVQDEMDGQALEGGVFFFKDDNGTDNKEQSLNPLLTAAQKARYASYRVYFNATYSTYRIEFYDKFCIGGPAVNGIEETTGNEGRYFDAEYRHGMQKATINGIEHYYIRREFCQGSTFAFFENPESFASNYSEDDDYEFVNNNKTGENYNPVWKTQAPTGENAGKDYPFHNTVRFNENAVEDAANLGNGNNAILWTLPTGTYTLRFYEIGGKFIYTVDKPVKTINVTIASNSKNYGGWTAFSDDCAMWIPKGMKAYYASDIVTDNGVNKVKLTELKDYIPAHCGVLIYNESQKEEGSTRTNFYPVPNAYTKTFEGNNLLMDCSTEDKLINLSQEDNGDYNYYFTYLYTSNGKQERVPLNFWKVFPGSKPYKNSTYLHVDKKVTPLAYNVTYGNYSFADPANVESNSKGAYCLPFTFDDANGNETTGITVIRPATEKENDNVWYNMQGMRVSKPTTAGIYINNGKKVVIK